VAARPGWTVARARRASGRVSGTVVRQIQETPRILIPFPEKVRPTRRRTGRGLGGAQGGDGRLRGLSVRPSSVGRSQKVQLSPPTPHTLQLSYY